MWKQQTKRSNIPLLVQKFTQISQLEVNQIPEGFSISDCISFCLYLKDVNTIIQNTTKEQDEMKPKTSEEIQQVYEIHRQIIQYVQDVLQNFMDEFNQKFSRVYTLIDEDVPLHLLQFNGSDTFSLTMRTQNKTFISDGIILWKMMIVQLQEILKQYSISVLTSIYLGEICINFYENNENFFDFYLFGSAINGAIRGCKLSKALDLQLNMLVHKDFASNFLQKTSLIGYVTKKSDISYVKTPDATILSSFYIIPYSSINDLDGYKYNIIPFQKIQNEIQEFHSQIQPESKIMNTDQFLKTLCEKQEGFEGASIVKLVFSVPTTFSKSNLNSPICNQDSQSVKQQSNGKKQQRISCLDGVDWEEERRMIKVKLQQIINQIQQLLAILDVQYSNISYCAFQNLLTLRLIVRNKIDYSPRTALLISVIQQFKFSNLKRLKASSQLFFFYVLHQKGYETFAGKQQSISNISSIYHLRDRKVKYLSKLEGVLKYNTDIVNNYFRENPSNMLSFKTHWNPILNHSYSYQNASIFEEKRNEIINKLKEYINSPQNLSAGFLNDIVIIEGDIGSGKSSFMQLISNDIANIFKPGECVVFTKSLRGFLMQEIKLRFLPQNNKKNLRKQSRRLFLNTFNDIILRQSIHCCSQLDEQCLQTDEIEQQNKIAQRMYLTLTLQTFLTTDPLRAQPKPQAIQKYQKINGQSEDDEDEEVIIDDKTRDELVQLGFELLLEYLQNQKIKLIIFMIDDLQYQDKWSWEIMKKISQNTQKDFKIVILGTFRFHLPGELNEDIASYTIIEPKIIPMIRTSEQLFANNKFLNERIHCIESDTLVRINLNFITVEDQNKILIEAFQSFYTSKVDKDQSKDSINFILLQLFRRNQCNTPLKILNFLHMLCKASYILVYEIEQEGTDKKRLSQMSIIDESSEQSNQQSPVRTESSLVSSGVLQNDKIRKIFIGINDHFQKIENTFFDSQINSPLYFSNLNNTILTNLFQEKEEVPILLPKSKYFIDEYKQLLNKQISEHQQDSSSNYLKDCKPVKLKNRNMLIWQALSLQGDRFNLNKIKFYLQNAFNIPEEQVLETITNLYLSRHIVKVKLDEEIDQNIKLSQNQLTNMIEFQFNENMFFLLKQSLKQKLSLRMKLLFHKSYFESMKELLQIFVQKEATETKDFAELYMELMHNNCEYSPHKIDILLKKISPQITYLFRNKIYYHGEAYKFSQNQQELVKCQLKLNSTTLLIYKDEEQQQKPNQNIKKEDMRDKNSSQKFQDQLKQIKAEAMLSTQRFQNIRSIWSIMKYDYSYELFPEQKMIMIHAYYLSKLKEAGDKFTENKDITLIFPNLSSYYTFYMGLRYLQIEQYHPDFSYEKKKNYYHATYSIKFPLLKKLPQIYDPLEKTNIKSSAPLSKTAKNIYFIHKNNNCFNKLPEIQSLKRMILQLIPQGILSLQQQLNFSKHEINNKSNKTQKSLNQSQIQLSPSQSQQNNKNIKQKKQEQSIQNQVQNYINSFQIPKNNSNLNQKIESNSTNSQNIDPPEISREIDNSNNQSKLSQNYEEIQEDTEKTQEERLLEMKILNENQPDTGKFVAIEGLSQIQENNSNQINIDQIQNIHDQTDTFRKLSGKDKQNNLDQFTHKNQQSLANNNQILQVIQEEQKIVNLSNYSEYNSQNPQQSQPKNKEQEFENDIFEQIELERAQFNEQQYQEQMDYYDKVYQYDDIQNDDQQNNLSSIQNENMFVNNSNLHLSSILKSQKHQKYTPSNAQSFLNNSIYQNLNIQLNNSSQIQSNRQTPLKMSITQRDVQFNFMPEIEEEENPLQTMNGIKILQLQLTPIGPATQSRSPSPYLKNSQNRQTHSSMILSQYANKKPNLITPMKLENESFASQSAYQTNNPSVNSQTNYSRQYLNNMEIDNYQKNVENNSILIQQSKKNQIDEINPYQNKNIQSFQAQSSISKQSPYNIEMNKQINLNKQQIIQQPIKSSNSSNQSVPNSDSQRQSSELTQSNIQTLNQIKFQKELQSRLQCVQLNKEEYKQKSEQIKQESLSNFNSHNIYKEENCQRSQSSILNNFQKLQNIEVNRAQSDVCDLGQTQFQQKQQSMNYISNSPNKLSNSNSQFNFDFNQQYKYNDDNNYAIESQNNQLKQSSQVFSNSRIGNNISGNQSLVLSSQSIKNQSLKNILESQQRQQQELGFKKSEKVQNNIQRFRQSLLEKDEQYPFQQNVNQKQLQQNQIIKNEQDIPNDLQQIFPFQDSQSILINQESSILKGQKYQSMILNQRKESGMNRSESNISCFSNSQNYNNNPIQEKFIQSNNNFIRNQLEDVEENNFQQEKMINFQNNDYNKEISNKDTYFSMSHQMPNLKYQNNRIIQQQLNTQEKEQQFQTEQQLPQSVAKAIQKQNQLFLKKKEKLKKYMSQNQSTIEGISQQESGERNQRVNSNFTVDDE